MFCGLISLLSKGCSDFPASIDAGARVSLIPSQGASSLEFRQLPPEGEVTLASLSVHNVTLLVQHDLVQRDVPLDHMTLLVFQAVMSVAPGTA